MVPTVLLLGSLNSSMPSSCHGSLSKSQVTVREKTILLPLLPLTLLLSTALHDFSTFELGVLANNVGMLGACLVTAPRNEKPSSTVELVDRTQRIYLFHQATFLDVFTFHPLGLLNPQIWCAGRWFIWDTLYFTF